MCKEYDLKKVHDSLLSIGLNIADPFKNTPLTCLTPCEHIKKVPPRRQSQYIGSSLDVVYRKLKEEKQGIAYHVIQGHRCLHK